MGKRAFSRRVLRRPHPTRRDVSCGDTDVDWPGAVLHMECDYEAGPVMGSSVATSSDASSLTTFLSSVVVASLLS